MSKSKLNTFQEDALKTAARTVEMHGFIDTIVMNALGLSGESGGFVDNVKKIAYHGHPLTPDKKVEMAYELGDVLWYVANAAKALGFSLDQIADMTIEKLKERYPDGFSSEKSVNRTPEVNVYVHGVKVKAANWDEPAKPTPLKDMPQMQRPQFNHAAAEAAIDKELAEYDRMQLEDDGKP